MRPESYASIAPAFSGTLPRGRECCLGEGEFAFGAQLTVAPEAMPFLGECLQLFGVEAIPCNENPQVALASCTGLPAEGFRLTVSSGRILVEYGDQGGLVYGINALEQQLYLAFRFGADQAFLEAGTLEDAPRLVWRGVMLDSSRHFQNADTVKRLLRAMGRLRLNRFHWHLSDNEGWRMPSQGAPELNALASLQKGAYSPGEIAEIRQVAKENAIQIIPEIDFPGHNHGLLELHPEFRCDKEHFSTEICLGNPGTLAFAKARIQEAMELFPESTYIHLGGDEAGDWFWNRCPVCQAKCAELHLENTRKLEEWFMRELSQFVVDRGRIPITWRTDAILTPKNVLQCWGNANDMRECTAHDNLSHQVISSIDNAYYLDYPQAFEEPRFPWMVQLSEEGVYSANAGAHMEGILGDRLLGLECPLWTEVVPQWRVEAKLFPRLVAAAESAWSPVKTASFADYQSRKKALHLAGYKWWR